MRVCWNVCCVASVVKDRVFSLRVLKYVVCLYKGVMDVVFSVCIVTRGAVGSRVWEVCSLLMVVEDERGDHMEEAYSRTGLMTAL